MRNHLRQVQNFTLSFLAAFIFPIFSFSQRSLKVFILAGQSNIAGNGEVYANANRRATPDKTGLYKNVVDMNGN